MNFWVPTFEWWGGGLDPSSMPWYAEYDWVEYYTYDENDSANPFKLSWKDEFDSIDTSRWHVTNSGSGFGANDCAFFGSQVYTKDGSLVLKMEPEAGYKAGSNTTPTFTHGSNNSSSSNSSSSHSGSSSSSTSGNSNSLNAGDVAKDIEDLAGALGKLF